MQLLQYFKELTIHPKNAKELKGLILQLAIQGKLTTVWRINNVKVKSASLNLKRIKAEKELQTVKKSEIPFKLNSSWEWAKFIDVAQLRHGHQFRKYDFVEHGIPVIKIGQCKPDGTLDFSKCNYIDSSREEEFKNDLIFKGHLLMALTGGTLGKVTRVDKDYGVLVQNYRVGNFFADERVITLDYLNVILESELFQSLVREKINQNAQPNIGKDSIEKIVMPIPPLEEQKEIVNVVDILFKEVEQLEQLTAQRIGLKEDFVISALNQLTTNNANEKWKYLQDHFKGFFNETNNIKKLRETVLQLAVKGKLTENWRTNNPDTEDASILLKRIQEEKAQLITDKKIKKEKALPPIAKEEVPYEIPDGWVWCRLNELTELITKGSSPKWQGVQYVDEGNGVLFVTSENVGNYKLIWKKKKFVESKFNEISARSILKRNDLLMNIVGGSIGRTAIYNIDELANINQAVTIIRLFPKVSYEYFLHFFNSPICISYMYDKQVDNARPNLSMSNIAKFMIPLPPLQEQKAIAEKVNALMSLCDALEQEVQQSQEYSEQLMQSVLREVFEPSNAS